ncbi:hypothetical protein TH8_08500 [Thalassospira profundimaris]|nr:hypothetical protein TH8_08500 [Thalassospira profundimaris]
MTNAARCSWAAPQHIKIQTYKRVWSICEVCGTAIPTQKTRYPFAFLPFSDLKKNVQTAEGMYDYFTTDVHIDHAKIEADQFYKRYLKDSQIDFGGKSILDVPGGNGFFINWFSEHLGARPSLAEYNKKTVEFAKQTHSFDCIVEYDMNADRLSEKVQKKFDIVVPRHA